MPPQRGKVASSIRRDKPFSHVQRNESPGPRASGSGGGGRRPFSHHQEDEDRGDRDAFRGSTQKRQPFAHHAAGDDEDYGGQRNSSQGFNPRSSGGRSSVNHRRQDEDDEFYVEGTASRGWNDGASSRPFANQRRQDDDDYYVESRSRGGNDQTSSRPVANQRYQVDDEDDYAEDTRSGGGNDRSSSRPFANQRNQDDDDFHVENTRGNDRTSSRPFANQRHEDDEGRYVEKTRSRGGNDRTSFKPSSNRVQQEDGGCERPSSRSGTLRGTRSGMRPFGHHTQQEESEERPKTGISRGGSSASGGFRSSKGGKKVGGQSMLLVEAAKVDKSAVLKALQSSQATDLESTEQLTGATPLMAAIDACPLHEIGNVVEVLLLHRANPNAQDALGRTPLHYCIEKEPENSRASREEREEVKREMVQVAKLLLNHNANPRIQDNKDKQSPLEITSHIRDAMGEAIAFELSLRSAEAKLPVWQPGSDLPVVPKRVRDVLSGAESAGHKRAAGHYLTYCKCVEVLETTAGYLPVDLRMDNIENFTPAVSHAATKQLREALEGADAILREYGKLPATLSTLIFDGVLSVHATVYEQYSKRFDSEEEQKKLSKFVDGKRGRYFRGYTWAFNDLIAKPEAEDLEKAVALGDSFPDGKGDSKPKQTRNMLEDVMTDAAAMQRKVVLLAAMIAERCKATHLVVHRPTGGEEPQQKRLFRSNEKVCLGDGVNTLLDVARGGIECPSMKSVCGALQGLLDEEKTGHLKLWRIKMRFATPSDGGWRDALINFTFTQDVNQHVCELQVMHKQMMTIRADMGAHKDYGQFRGALEILDFHGVDWQKLAKDGEPEEGGEGGAAGLAGSLSAPLEVGSAATARIEELQEMLREKDEELEEKDRRIMQLESQLEAVTQHGSPENAIVAKFKQWDVDGDGKIAREELASMMRSLNANLTDEELDVVFQQVDSDNSGTIDYSEFVKWVLNVGGFQGVNGVNGD
eukprot:TRINITY_DN33745_c0_g1_i1.p1 TRINITY_DN33745_c0_g1~~TRINITY_DN33745_c0_g1_i1.p1  ORF type:complete len:980 (+),score=208.29 TRINITY_DN33745_c0_g1_i1:118-3057(+)